MALASYLSHRVGMEFTKMHFAWRRMAVSTIRITRLRGYWGQLGQYLKDRGHSIPCWGP